MGTKELAAILCLLALALGYVCGREASYSPLAERAAICETGLSACEHGLTYCGARLATFEEWAREARERSRTGRGVGVGPVGH